MCTNVWNLLFSTDSVNKTALGHDLSTGRSYGVVFGDVPFSEGACKLAYHGELAGAGPRNGEHVCIKVMKTGPVTTAVNWKPEMSVAQNAVEFAKTFTRQLEKCGIKNYPQIEFCLPIITKVSESAFVTKEDKIQWDNLDWKYRWNTIWGAVCNGRAISWRIHSKIQFKLWLGGWIAWASDCTFTLFFGKQPVKLHALRSSRWMMKW